MYAKSDYEIEIRAGADIAYLNYNIFTILSKSEILYKKQIITNTQLEKINFFLYNLKIKKSVYDIKFKFFMDYQLKYKMYGSPFLNYIMYLDILSFKYIDENNNIERMFLNINSNITVHIVLKLYEYLHNNIINFYDNKNNVSYHEATNNRTGAYVDISNDVLDKFRYNNKSFNEELKLRNLVEI